MCDGRAERIISTVIIAPERFFLSCYVLLFLVDLMADYGVSGAGLFIVDQYEVCA